MGKTLTKFRNGWAGKISRAVGNIVVSMKNASAGNIAFGAPVFWDSTNKGVVPFDAATCTADNFVGIAVNVGDKSPELYESNEGVFTPKDPVDVLTQGSVILEVSNYTAEGAALYIKKSDGTITSSAGEAGTTIQIPNAITRTARDSNHMIEVLIRARNVM